MEVLSKLLEQKVSNTIPETEDYTLVVIDKHTHEENLSQILQTNDKEFEKSCQFFKWVKWYL